MIQLVFNRQLLNYPSLPSSSSGKASSHKASAQTQHVVHCQACARKRNHLLNDFVMLNQFNLEDLKSVYNQFQLYVPSLQTSGLTSLIWVWGDEASETVLKAREITNWETKRGKFALIYFDFQRFCIQPFVVNSVIAFMIIV